MRKKPVHRAILLGEAVNDLMEAEYTMARLESNDVFEALSPRQTRQYHVVLNLLRELIHDLRLDTAHEQWAS